jgi:hypothetical protein
MKICFSLLHVITLVLVMGLLASAQVDVPQAKIVNLTLDRHEVAVLHLRTGYVSSVRLSGEEVSSVVLGDVHAFKAEHSEAEPQLVFFKPIGTRPSQTNALITTTTGHQISLTLVSEGAASRGSAVDYVLEFEPPRSFVIAAARPSFVIGDTRTVEPPIGNAPAKALVKEPDLHNEGGVSASSWEGKQLRVSVGRTKESAQEMTVEFSVLNSSSRTIELLPPQIQLAGTSHDKHKKAIKAEPLAVKEYRLTTRRLPPGGRAEGVVVFERPAFKESRERLTLRIAPADEVDKPVLAPIAFVATTGGSK